MSKFKPIEAEWKGSIKVIQPENILRLVAQVEDIITLTELSVAMNSTANGQPKIPMGKIALAYAILLRFAGFNVTDDEVYAEMFNQSSKTENKQLAMVDYISLLLLALTPPDRLQKALSETGKSKAVGSRRGAKSKRSTVS